MIRRLALLAILAVAMVGLAACDTAEERAQKHYEKALSYIEAGDADRAVVEFRNVFKLDGYHRDARLSFAAFLEGQGNLQAAYGHYLLLLEQNPQDVQSLTALARLGAEINNWDEAARHANAAAALVPDDPVVRGVLIGLDYRNAMTGRDWPAASAAAVAARQLLELAPDQWLPRQVLIDDRVRNEDWTAALSEIDDALERFPDTMMLYQFRLGVLEQLGDEDGIALQLRAMADRFPDAGLHRVLANRYIARERLDEAEAYLRSRIEANPDDVDGYLELFSFLQEQLGSDAARAEVDRVLSADTPHGAVFRSVRAVLEFEAGQQDEAVADMNAILANAEASEETDRIRLTLARMLNAMNNRVGARAAVEEVLAHDPTQVDALKLKAKWLIEEDQPGDALVELRTALDQAPRDPTIMTLMALAHERVGNRDLMGEMLGLATEASGNAPDEALRYARFLIQREKLLSAEDVLLNALRLRNTHPQILDALGNVYIRLNDWPRAGHIIARLTEIGSEETLAIANELTARKLAGQERADELEAFLTGLANGESGLQAAASIVRLRLAQGDVEGARTYLDGLLQADPENPTLRYINAGVLFIDGQAEQAASIFNALLEEDPGLEQVWMALYNMRRSRGEDAQAAQVLEASLQALPKSGPLRWAKASQLEREGDITGAIAIYEALYEDNRNSVVIANNLASLIATYDDSEEGLQRAFTIARRLRDTDVPAFQDTYGWISFRLGNPSEALGYLQPAAAALTEDPAVQFHLAETYAALGLRDEALEQYRKVIALAANLPLRPPFMDQVTEAVAQLTRVDN